MAGRKGKVANVIEKAAAKNRIVEQLDKVPTNGKAKGPPAPGAKSEIIRIKPLRQSIITCTITGVSPYMQMRFSRKAAEKMRATHEAGSQARGKKEREKRDFDADYRGAMYVFADGGHGIPATCFRQAMISACRIVSFKMTLAKLSIFIESDGGDKLDGTPLIRLKGKPQMDIRPARNANGSMDLRSRPLWKEWSAVVKIRFDEDQFSPSDIVNLLTRVGMQVGIGEGRPDSRESAGMGLGTFSVEIGTLKRS